VLERWDFRDAGALRTLIEASARRAASDESVRPSCVEAEALDVSDHWLASGLSAYLASVDVIGRELPILYRDEHGVAWSGTIDLLYRDPDGRLVVADYKSDSRPDDERRARYRAQLSTYARGVARIFPDEPEPLLELIWLREGRRERLRLESPP
jgi:ATP-dependent helicase/nuclease subunit A